MFICCCTGKNEEAVKLAARSYLEGIYTVTDKVVVNFRTTFGSMDNNCGGSCLASISKILMEEANKMNVNIHLSASNPRCELIKIFKSL